MAYDPQVVSESLRVLVFGMAGILATVALLIGLTALLRRAFPPKPEPERGERSNEL